MPGLLTDEQRQALQAFAESEVKAVLRRRAQVLLAYQSGASSRQAAQQAGLSITRARYWRRQFLRRGMDIFSRQRQAQIIEALALSLSEASSQVAEAGDASPASAQAENNLSQAAEQAFRNAFTALDPAPSEATPAPARPFPGPIDRPGISAGDSLAEAGRKVMLYQFSVMLQNEPGTRLGEDIEALHDMRVATRRMRAAFEVFGGAFRPKTLQPILKGMRATGRALGRVRDLDVLIEKAQAFEKATPEVQPGSLDRLILSWQNDREAARADLIEHLDSPTHLQFLRRFNDFVQTPGAGTRQDLAGKQSVYEAAPVLIYTRLASVRAYGSLLENASLDELHALRIEFKKLRYTVEFFREALGPEAKEVIDTIKGLQDHLGELNDHRVALGLLGDFLGKWETIQGGRPLGERESAEGIVAYLAYHHAGQHARLVSFPEAWARFDHPNFRQKLALAISTL